MYKTVNLVDQDELKLFENKLHAYLSGDLDEDTFTAARLQQGVYGQRQDGQHMVRIKVPGGRLNREQLSTVGDVIKAHSGIDYVSVTTRQDLQLHFIPLSETAATLNDLSASGLTSREACGNTVRNVTACPLAGVCAHEHTDVQPYLDAVVIHFLRHPLTQHLPRKFKMSFSGCETDCAQALMHDLAVVAVRNGEQIGFKVFAGGGLGHKPREAIELESCLPPEKLLASIEAVITVHHHYSDRRKRARSRIKFLVDKFGEEGFRRHYREALTRTEAAVSSLDLPGVIWRTGLPGTGRPPNTRQVIFQRQAGFSVVPVNLPLGDLTIDNIRFLVKLMSDENLDHIRTTVDQNLLLVNVPTARVDDIQIRLAEGGLVRPSIGEQVIACPGTWTCRLGITSARKVALKLNGGEHDLRIGVSGCHNGCAQPTVADIGLHGEGRRLFGKLIPFYRLHLGGDGRIGGGIAIKGPEVPSARVDQVVEKIKHTFAVDKNENELFSHWARRKGAPFFTELLEDYTLVGPDDLPDLLRDHGSREEFRVLQLGGGECAGIAEETVSAWLAEASSEQTYRDAFLNRNDFSEAVACGENILRLAAKSLLSKYGRAGSDELNRLANDLVIFVHGQGKLVSQFYELQTVLQKSRKVTSKESLQRTFKILDAWLEEVKHAELPQVLQVPSVVPEVVDISNEDCPMHYIRARMALDKTIAGQVTTLKVKQGEAIELVSQSLLSVGYTLLSQTNQDDGTVLARVLNSGSKSKPKSGERRKVEGTASPEQANET